MPREEAMLGGETRHGECLDRLVRHERSQNPGRGAGVSERQRGDVDDAPFTIARGPVDAHEFAYSVSWRFARLRFRQHLHLRSPFLRWAALLLWSEEACVGASVGIHRRAALDPRARFVRGVRGPLRNRVE
jgi:hypothetical protein